MTKAHGTIIPWRIGRHAAAVAKLRGAEMEEGMSDMVRESAEVCDTAAPPNAEHDPDDGATEGRRKLGTHYASPLTN